MSGESDPARLLSWLMSANGTAPPEGGEPDTRPRLNAVRDDFATLTPMCWEAVSHANDPPRMFTFEGMPVRLDGGDGDPFTPRLLDKTRLGYEVARAVRWFKTAKVNGETIVLDSSPRRGLIEDMLAAPSFPLPKLERIVSAPILGIDGSLDTTSGYHPASRTYYDGSLELRKVPRTPADETVSDALDFLLSEFLVDFPFVAPSDVAHALGELFLPFVRAMIPGPTPLHVHEAPTQGTGKDLLAEVMCRVATGRDPQQLNYSERSEEFGKRLLAMLRTLPEWIVVPNVTGTLDNNELTNTISSGQYTNRLLGVSETLCIPARNVWTLTSNNAQLNADMVRRSVRVRMDAEMERPETRTAFRHRPLKPWVDMHRADLVWSCLVICRSWVRAGMEPGTETLGGFEDWARVIGGILDHIECDGFLRNRDEFIAQADTGSDAERAFVTEWWEQRGPAPSGVADLYPIAIDEKVNFDIEAKSPRGERTRLGARLRTMRDRRYRVAEGETVVVTGMGVSHQAALWKLAKEVPRKGSPDGGTSNEGSPEVPL